MKLPPLKKTAEQSGILAKTLEIQGGLL